MNTRSTFIKTAITSDDEDDGQLYKHDKCLNRQPRPLNDISTLLKMMVKLNKHVDAGAGAGRSQLSVNRCAYVDYSDSTDDEGLTQHYYGKIKHFSHPHNLSKYTFQQNSQTNCKVCGLQLVGSAYGCQSCRFYMHASCFDLPQKIQHDAHQAHPLTLRYPSYYKHCVKGCNACGENIERSFLYCCEICRFDLHVTCATLYNTVKTADGSTLRLYYTDPIADYWYFPRRCNVCYGTVSEEGWSYCSKEDRRIAHINCAKGKFNPSWIKESLNMIKTK